MEGQTLRVWAKGKSDLSAVTLKIPLLGYHQAVNAATAFAALETVNHQRLSVSIEAIQSGFANVFWPGRFEIIQKSPPIVLDCAHNRDSALKLRLTLEEYYPGKPVILIFGASEDKDIRGMFSELMPIVNEMIAVKSYHPRAIEPEKLVEMAQPYGCPVQILYSVPEAVEKAIQQVGEDGVVLVTGSIFVVAEARKYWEKKADIRRY
jgi:dihydrofolate synthase/folylpolyglutamate synthase